MTLIADTKVTQSKRKSIELLGLIGEIGGFYEAMFIMVGVLAAGISKKLFQYNLSRSYFIRQKEKEENENSEDQSIDNQFERISFTNFQLFFDPFARKFLNFFVCFKQFRSFECLKRLDILEKCESRFE